MAIAIDQTFERIRRVVLRIYPGAAATPDVRGVHRIRSFRVAQNGRENYVLTFIIDESSIAALTYSSRATPLSLRPPRRTPSSR